VIAAVLVVLGVATLLLIWRGKQSNPQARATIAYFEALKSAVQVYRLTENDYPIALSRLQTARPPYLPPQPLVDGWGSAFIYQPTPDDVHPFTLRSAGPDRIPGTADDLDAWATPP
jgi:type II secretory pathway pseudopilin PulG